MWISSQLQISHEFRRQHASHIPITMRNISSWCFVCRFRIHIISNLTVVRVARAMFNALPVISGVWAIFSVIRLLLFSFHVFDGVSTRYATNQLIKWIYAWEILVNWHKVYLDGLRLSWVFKTRELIVFRGRNWQFLTRKSIITHSTHSGGNAD